MSLETQKLTATNPTDVRVEWDPNVTVDDGRFYHQGKDTDFSVPALSTIVAEALGVTDDSGSTDLLSSELRTPMPVKVTSAILDAVEQADAWQNWVGRMSADTLEYLNPTPHNIFMRFDPQMSETYDCARDITDVWWMNMGGGIPIEVLKEFERIVDELGTIDNSNI